MKLVKEPDFPELQRDETTKVWYVRKFVAGKGALFKSTGESRSKTKAKQKALKILTDFLQKQQPGVHYTFRDIAREVLQEKKSKKRATHASARLHLEKRLIPFFGNYRIDQITEATVKDYFAIRRLERPDGKLFNDRKHIIMVLNRAYEKGLRSRPFKIANPDPKTNAGKVYSRLEEVLLLKNAKDDLRLQILMGIKMGMRVGEILKLKLSRIDFSERVIRLTPVDTKTKMGRVVPIHPRVLRLLRKRSGEWLFPSPSGRGSIGHQGNKTAWATCKREAGVTGRFHDLRHTCATRMAERGVNPIMAARVLGMDLAVYDKVYCKPSEAALRSAMDEFFKL